MKAHSILILSLATLILSLHSQACTGKDDHLPHATQMEIVDHSPGSIALRVHLPYRTTRYGGGAPGRVYYSKLKNPEKVCQDLVFSWERSPWKTIADQSKWAQASEGHFAARFEYIKKSARYERLQLPAGLSEVYFHTLYSMKDDDYERFTSEPRLAPRKNLVSVDCQILF
jgi:hypothetical protein